MASGMFGEWMRTRFVAINTVLEFEAPIGATRARLVADLLSGQEYLPDPPPGVECGLPAAEDRVMQAHLLAGMLHAACARHGVTHDARLARCEAVLQDVANRCHVAPRFLALPYLVLNPAVAGVPQTFLDSADERAFIEANAAGVAIYEQVWTAVARIRDLGLSHGAVPLLLGQATTTLAALRDVHRDLGERLTRDVYVRHIRHYYAGAPVGGIEWQGVNAGDQAWSMALDLALGIAQTSARYLDYMRSRLPYLVPSHRELVLRELSGPGWLEEARHVVRADHTPSFRTALRALYDALVDVTWAHHDLAVQFVDDAVGTSGVEVRFLEETIRMRRDVPLLRELR